MSADSVQKQKNFCDKQNFSYPILADETKETLKAYGAWGVKKMYGREYEGIIRCSFLINVEGIVEKVYDKVKTKSHAKDILSDIGYISSYFYQETDLGSYLRRILKRIQFHECRLLLKSFHLVQILHSH